MCSPEPLLLLFQTPRIGNKPLMGILLLRVPVRCDVVRTVIFDGVGLFGLILRVAVVGRWFNAVFFVRWLTLLYRWVCMSVVSSGVDRGVIFSCAVVAVFAEAGFGAASVSSL